MGLMIKTLIDTELLTYAKITLSDFKVLANLISEHSKLVKETARETEEEESDDSAHRILSDREILDALNGPLQKFFKDKLIAYSTIARVRLELTISKEELFKEYREQPQEFKLNKKYLENITLSDISDIQNKLDQLCEEHYEKWQEKLAQWQQAILKKLDEKNITLSIIEIQEFQGKEPLSELLDRFTDLKIELPKTKKREMNYSDYLKYKTDIAILSALSRQHLPHEEKEINKILKSLKSVFDSITQEVNQLIKSQEKETQKMIENIAFAKFKKS